jgi:hypothetical protein
MLQRLAVRLREFEEIMDRYYRRNPVEERNAGVKEAFVHYDEWVQREKSKLDAELAALDKHMTYLREVESQVISFRERLERENSDVCDVAAVNAYNNLVAENNKLVQDYQYLAQAYKQNQDSYNSKVTEFNKGTSLRMRQAQEKTKEAEEKLKTYWRWKPTGAGLRRRGTRDFSKILIASM